MDHCLSSDGQHQVQSCQFIFGKHIVATKIRTVDEDGNVTKTKVKIKGKTTTTSSSDDSNDNSSESNSSGGYYTGDSKEGE